MTRRDLIHFAREKFGLTQAESNRFVKEMFSFLADGLVKEGRVTIRDLGTFSIKRYPSRKAWNVRTGELAVISSRKRIKFRPARSLAARVRVGGRERYPYSY